MLDLASVSSSSMADQGSLVFREQIENLVTWFSNWSECEQTVAIYTLLRHLGPKQSRFVEHLLQEQASSDIHIDDDENHANNLNFVQSMEKSNHETGVHKSNISQLLNMLLHHFPLLHPGNDTVKQEYLRLIPQVLSHCIDQGERIEECRKLLTYTLIHPAVTNSERNDFYKWLNELEKFKYGPKSNISMNLMQQLYNIGGFRTMSYGDVLSQNHQPYRIMSPVRTTPNSVNSNDTHRRLSRTVSAPHRNRMSAVGDMGENHGTSSYISHGYPSNGPFNHKTQARRHMSIGSTLPEDRVYSPVINNNNHTHNHPNSDGGCPRVIVSKVPSSTTDELSPHGSLGAASSSGDSDGDENQNRSENYQCSAMTDFPVWLKSLRLHKYNDLFIGLSYEEMLNVDGKFLDERNVTTGAKNKLMQSISKLRSRASELETMEQEVLQGQNLSQILSNLKLIVNTPISKASPNTNTTSDSQSQPNQHDLPQLICKVMGRLCTQLLVNSKVTDDCFSKYLQLIERCLHIDAFTGKQRNRLQEWKTQVIQRSMGRMTAMRTDSNPQRTNLHRPTGRTYSWKTNPRVPTRRNPNFPQRMDYLPCPWDANSFDKKPLQLTYSGPANTFQHSILANGTDEVFDGAVKRAVHRTQSAPIKHHTLHPNLSQYNHNQNNHIDENQASEPEINECLDSLARSMTEHALSSQDSVEHDDSIQLEQ